MGENICRWRRSRCLLDSHALKLDRNHFRIRRVAQFAAFELDEPVFATLEQGQRGVDFSRFEHDAGFELLADFADGCDVEIRHQALDQGDEAVCGMIDSGEVVVGVMNARDGVAAVRVDFAGEHLDGSVSV